jgi:hypothetical protein
MHGTIPPSEIHPCLPFSFEVINYVFWIQSETTIVIKFDLGIKPHK